MLTLGAMQGGAAALLIAVAIDAVCGEPPARWHPVVWVGHALSAIGAPWPEASRAGAFLRGAGAWMVGALVSSGVAMLALRAITVVAQYDPLPWRGLLQAVLCGVLLKPLFALRMLQNEVMAVECATAVGVVAARERLSGIVGRDTTVLTMSEVRESALESLAENLNDSFVAPLFWFVLGGLPAAALYRFANTAAGNGRASGALGRTTSCPMFPRASPRCSSAWPHAVGRGTCGVKLGEPHHRTEGGPWP
jgi:adenosylcobinamide-phosphate synthase